MNIQIKYGFDGLKAVVYSESKRLGEIIISKDMPKIFDFLGLSWERFQEGFDDLEDIFDYVISSPYFDPESFKLENLNAINRRRNNRRKVYNQFVEYVKDMESKFEFQKDKDTYLQMIHDHFSDINFLGKIEELRKLEAKKKANHAKFNGKLIMEKYPELHGIELGRVLKDFQKSIIENGITFDDYLEIGTPDSIMIDFSKFYQNDNK